MPPIEQIVETAAYVDDLESAERFYQDVLGLERIARLPGRHVFFRVGDRDVLLLFRAAETLKGDLLPAHGSTGPGHFALGVPTDALDAWREWLGKHSIGIEKEVQWPHGGRSLYFRDPAGNSVELSTRGIWNLPTGW